MEGAIELYRKEGAAGAQALVNTGVGRRTMDDIRAEVDGIAATHRNQVDDASNRWTKDVSFARLGMQIVTAVTIALFLIVWLLARRDAEQREARRLGVQRDKQRLETLVEERTAALSELSTHLQDIREEEKSKLARDIHDELGGILVSVKMDVEWAERHIKQRDPESAAKLARALQMLDESVQMKRRIVEELRPTLLDNLGLSAAFDWQLHEVCDRADLKFTITTPPDDSGVVPGVSIALYRILQEALTNIVKYAKAKQVNVDLAVTADSVKLLIEDDGVGIPDDAQNNLLSHGITGMRQRVRALHGQFSIARRGKGGTAIKVTIPIEPVTEPLPEPSEAVAAPARTAA